MTPAIASTRGRLALSAAAAALLAGQPAMLSAKAGDKARRADNKRAYEAMDGAFECMMKRNPGQVRTYLASVPGSDIERRIGWYLYRRVGDCLSRATWVRFHGVMGRGVAAERLLATDFPGAAPLRTPVGEGEFGPLSKAMKLEPAIASGYAFARCVSIADPEGALRVLRTARGSTAEQAAMRALRPSFPACVVAGATFSIDRWTFRPFLAEAIYQIYRSRSGVPGPGGAAMGAVQ